MKDNISKLKDCYGCGVCVIACPKKIIDLELNRDGFYSPVIHEQDKCIDCGICLDICAYNHDELATPPDMADIKAYGCWSKDESVRQECTTGGLGYEIARSAIHDNEKACVVKYDVDKMRAEHYIADSIEDLQSARGSKYIPSYTQSGFEQIKKDERYVVFGLPCQIDSMRRYIKRFKIERNMQLVDLLCHGAPSLLLWQRYLEELGDATGKVQQVKFRSKEYGWHNSACVEIEGEKRHLIQDAKNSLFYGLFFTDSCLNKCYHGKCKYKLLSSSADIRIGDFWGKKYANNDQGVNVLISFNETGDGIVEKLKERCVFQPATLEEAMDKQMPGNAPSTPFRRFLLWGFRHGIKLKMLLNIVKLGIALQHPGLVLNKIARK